MTAPAPRLATRSPEHLIVDKEYDWARARRSCRCAPRADRYFKSFHAAVAV